MRLTVAGGVRVKLFSTLGEDFTRVRGTGVGSTVEPGVVGGMVERQGSGNGKDEQVRTSSVFVCKARGSKHTLGASVGITADVCASFIAWWCEVSVAG